MKAILRRIGYGRPRQPMEPHRPLPWLARGVAWLLVAAGFGLFAAMPPLLVSDRTAGAASVAGQLGVVALLVAVFVRLLGGFARPTPVVLKQFDEEA